MGGREGGREREGEGEGEGECMRGGRGEVWSSLGSLPLPNNYQKYNTTVTSPWRTYLDHHTYMHRRTHIHIRRLFINYHLTTLKQHGGASTRCHGDREGR